MTTYQAQNYWNRAWIVAGAIWRCITEKYSRSINLTSRLGPCYELPAYPFTDIISYDEQFDFAVKKEFCIKPILLPMTRISDTIFASRVDKILF